MGPQDEPASLCRAPLVGSRFPGDPCSRDGHSPAMGWAVMGAGLPGASSRLLTECLLGSDNSNKTRAVSVTRRGARVSAAHLPSNPPRVAPTAQGGIPAGCSPAA